MNITKITAQLKGLHDTRARKVREHEAELAKLDASIAKFKKAIDRINEFAEAMTCPTCRGDGSIKCSDAAGGADWDICDSCDGTGVIKELKKQTSKK